MTRLTEDDVRRIIREEIAADHWGERGKRAALNEVSVHTRLRPEERLRGAPNSVTYRFTARELKQVLTILPGLQILHPGLDLPAVVDEVKRILADAEEVGDE